MPMRCLPVAIRYNMRGRRSFGISAVRIFCGISRKRAWSSAGFRTLFVRPQTCDFAFPYFRNRTEARKRCIDQFKRTTARERSSGFVEIFHRRFAVDAREEKRRKET